MKYRADLDGMRAVAVILVILNHALSPFLHDGGSTGVTAFFVLSGYLITRLLIAERDQSGRIDLRSFYLRRILRLGPALLLLLAFVAFMSRWVVWPGDWRTGIVASLLYVSNWVQINGYQIQPLGHTWTLAIEEQFYLLWPVVFILVGTRWALRLAIAGVIVGAIAATLASGTFEFFSTVTRGNAILAGCVVGIVQPTFSRRIGVAGLVLLLAVSAVSLSHDVAIPIAILASCLMVSSSVPALGSLAFVGKRAYGLYLWNWPMAILLGGALGVIATFVMAGLSYRLLERPLTRRFGPGLHRRASARSLPVTTGGPPSGPPSSAGHPPTTAVIPSDGAVPVVRGL